MKVGIVGHEAKKFTPITEKAAKLVIRALLKNAEVLVSGGCHLGGVDIWAEEIAKELGCYNPDYIHLPKIQRWEGGYRQRNLKIAEDSDIVHCIVVAEYPPIYYGVRFDYCYHCNTSDHVKSGGCWTAKRAKSAEWHVIYPDGKIQSSRARGP